MRDFAGLCWNLLEFAGHLLEFAGHCGTPLEGGGGDRRATPTTDHHHGVRIHIIAP
jgi:hypothetical protein